MTTTSAFVSTVDANHNIALPKEILVGSRVAVVVLPTVTEETEEVNRNSRFQSVLDAIREAIASNFSPPQISDDELNELIQEARHTKQQNRDITIINENAARLNAEAADALQYLAV